MSDTRWMMDVVDDLAAFSIQNGLPKTALRLAKVTDALVEDMADRIQSDKALTTLLPDHCPYEGGS